ncbi:probable proteasome inhibitor isoform X2 [Cucurbita maxima]|uniref:Probable proteasome inhibitor isoform X2 n=1 Tax=Cucurbita maxima TaxID=3661 RepID=A0A6J1ITK3_CUCMA|nr:probable proteasome inhibitor isoform X2 [Cucurbita maxima]
MVNEKSVMAVIRATRPTFRNDNDKVAFAVHAIFLASGCVLTATGPPAFTDAAFSSPSKDEISIEGWNELEDEYAYVYANLEKDSNWKKVIVKCLVMNGKLLIDALTDENSEPLHLEIDVEEIVNPNGGSNYSTQYRNLDTLVKRLGLGILSKLGGSSKATTSNPARAESESSERSSVVVNKPTSGIPELPGPLLDPSGGGFSGDGSMLLGPNDPRWLGIGIGPGFEGGQPGVPPGARFDPYGPPGVPGFEPFRFVRNPGRPGGGTHPDLEHFGDGSDFI